MRTEVVNKFRFYATLCREFAEDALVPEYRAHLLAQADRWERDAMVAQRDIEAIASSRELIARIDAELKLSN